MDARTIEEALAYLSSDEFLSTPVKDARSQAGTLVRRFNETIDLLVIVSQLTTEEVSKAALKALGYSKSYMYEKIDDIYKAILFFNGSKFNEQNISDARKDAAAICSRLTGEDVSTDDFIKCEDIADIATKAQDVIISNKYGMDTNTAVLKAATSILEIARDTIDFEAYKKLCTAVAIKVGANPGDTFSASKDPDKLYEFMCVTFKQLLNNNGRIDL